MRASSLRGGDETADQMTGIAWMGGGPVVRPHPITLEEKQDALMDLGTMVLKHKLLTAFTCWRRQFREHIGKIRMMRIMSVKQMGVESSGLGAEVRKEDVDLRTRQLWASFDQVVGLEGRAPPPPPCPPSTPPPALPLPQQHERRCRGLAQATLLPHAK